MMGRHAANPSYESSLGHLERAQSPILDEGDSLVVSLTAW